MRLQVTPCTATADVEAWPHHFGLMVLSPFMAIPSKMICQDVQQCAVLMKNVPVSFANPMGCAPIGKLVLLH